MNAIFRRWNDHTIVFDEAIPCKRGHIVQVVKDKDGIVHHIHRTEQFFKHTTNRVDRSEEQLMLERLKQGFPNEEIKLRHAVSWVKRRYID